MKKNSSYKAILVWVIATCFYLYENLLQVSQSVIVPELMRDFNLNASELSSSIGSIFLVTYSFCQFPVGVILDRINTRILLPIAVFICTSACFLYSNSYSVEHAAISRGLMGIGASFAALSCLKLASTWFEHKHFAFLTGLMLSIGLTGSIIGESPLLFLTNSYGWRTALEYIAISGVVLLILISAIVKDGPNKTVAKSLDYSSIKTDLKNLLTHRNVWLTALYGMLMFTPFLVFSNLWGPTFISVNFKLDREASAHIFEMIFYGFILGAPFFGWLSDYISKRKLPLMISSVGALITITMILYVKVYSVFYISSLIFLLGLFTSGFLPAFSIMKEINNPDVSSSALGFMNTLNSLGAPILMYIIGNILDSTWNGTISHGIRIYTETNFHLAFSLLPISYVIAIIFLFLLPETNCKTLHSKA
jgi:sugar phosphate permease